MKRPRSLILSIIVLPVNGVILIPRLILWLTGWPGFDRLLASPLGAFVLAGGLLLIVLGLYLAGKTISLFATGGRGTPAPWAPPQA